MTNKTVRYGIVGIAVVLLVVVSFAGAVSADPEGTAISTKSDWLNLTDQSGYYYLENDIDFGGESAYISSFSGTLNGKYHTIYNFSIGRSDTNYVGIIGSYSGTSISNLTISNFSVSGHYYVGGLFGYSLKACVIENVIAMNGDVTASSLYSGGLVGRANSEIENFDNCTVKNCRVSGIYGVGGLVGAADDANVIVNTSCVIGCDIEGDYYVGGVVGRIVAACTKFDLKNSEVANCVIKSSTGYSGGCLGCCEYEGSNERIIDNCRVKNCVTYASSGSGSYPCGGIIGGCVFDKSTNEYPSVSNCRVEFCTIAGKGTNSVGGIAGTFPTAGTLDRNNVISSCIVSVSGKAAGICPTAATTS